MIREGECIRASTDFSGEKSKTKTSFSVLLGLNSESSNSTTSFDALQGTTNCLGTK